MTEAKKNISININLLERFLYIDQILSGGRKIAIKDLRIEINKNLIKKKKLSVSIRTIYKDVENINSIFGPQIDLENGIASYYDSSFSIFSKKILPNEYDDIKNGLDLLLSIDGLENIDYLKDLYSKIVGIERSEPKKQIIFLEKNPKQIDKYFKELHHFILNKCCIEVSYQNYNSKAIISTFHPYILKRHNTRWYVFGFSAEKKQIINFPLDRITGLKQLPKVAFLNEIFNPKTYFNNIVGVSIIDNEPVQKIIIKATKEEWNYINSRYLHQSQKKIQETETHTTFSIDVAWNKELEKLLLSYGNGIEILEPLEIRDKMKNIYENANKRYN